MSNDSTQLRLVVLGQSAVWRADRLLTDRLSLDVVLLIILHWNSSRFISRDTLMKLLWPNRAIGANAKHSLSQVTCRLKSRFPSVPVESTMAGLRLAVSDAIASDAADLIMASRRLDFQAVRELDAGPFCGVQAQRVNERFEEWASGVNVSLRRTARDACRAEMLAAKGAGHWGRVEDAARILLHLDKHDLIARRELVEAVAMSGDFRRAAALSVGRRGAVGAPKTTNIQSVRALREAAANPEAAPIAVQVSFVGRSAEFRSLSSRMQLALQGRAQAILLEGEPGIGKTRLARHFLRYLAIKGWRILAGACRPTQRFVPCAHLTDMLRSGVSASDCADVPELYRGWLYAILPDLAPGGYRSRPDLITQVQLLEAVRSLCTTITNRAPLALFLDDVQWIDERTAVHLDFLLRTMSDCRLLMLVTMRQGESVPPLQGAFLKGLLADSDSTIRIGQLSRPEVDELIDASQRIHGCRIDQAARDRAFDMVGGRPFFLLELLRSAVSDRRYLDRTKEPDQPVHVPEVVRRAILSQTESLSVDSERLLHALAVAGGEADAALLMQIAGVSVDAVPRCTDELIARGFVADGLRGIRIAHDLLRDSIMSTMGVMRRGLIHERLAKALVSRRAAAAEIADHFLHAGLHDEAFPYKVRAARNALCSEAFADAEILAREAVDIAVTSSQQLTASETLLDVLCAKARYDKAATVIRGNVLARRRGQAASVRREVIEFLGSLADSAAVDQSILLGNGMELADVARDCLTPSEYGELLRGIAQGAHGAKDLEFWRAFLLEMRRRGLEIDEPGASAGVLAACACVEAIYLDAGHARATAADSRERAERSGKRLALARSHGALGTVLLLQGSLDRGAQSLSIAVNIASHAGHSSTALAARNNLAIAQMELGHWSVARELLEMSLESAFGQQRLFVLTNLAFCLQELGNMGAARRCSATILQVAGSSAVSWARAGAHAVLGIDALSTGSIGGSTHHAREIEGVVGDLELLSSDCSYAEVFLAKHALAVDRVYDGIRRISSVIRGHRPTYSIALMRMQVAHAELVARMDLHAGRTDLHELRERSLRMGALGVSARVDSALADLRRRSPARSRTRRSEN
jgi:DNA-binding SARP family transcriptional activator